jgi:hypothetical protein
MRQKHSNDNEETWQTLACVNKRVVDRLKSEKQQSNRADDGQRSHGDKQKREQDSAYVEQRLRDFSAFERRFGRNKN